MLDQELAYGEFGLQLRAAGRMLVLQGGQWEDARRLFVLLIGLSTQILARVIAIWVDCRWMLALRVTVWSPSV